MSFQPWAFVIVLPTLPGVLLLDWMFKRQQRARRHPFEDFPVLRPPGESCRTKADEILEGAGGEIALFAAAPIVTALTAYYASASITCCEILTAGIAALTLFLILRLKSRAHQISNYWLGFEGERMVGQLLSGGLSKGWRVFHDVPFSGFNIDHVVVAPTGVFVIETKTRRKPRRTDGYEVIYDGMKLISRDWTNDEAISQALRNAKTLSGWLTKSVGEPVWVEPIVTLPGWYVKREGKGRVSVLNPKEIIGLIDAWNGTNRLSPELIQRIAHQIGQIDVIK
jgi:hypothetical protein